jgi:hypothetical protein
MFEFILSLFRRERRNENGVSVRRWTVHEPNRVRTFEETTQAISGSGVSITFTSTDELATSRQIEFLRKLGFPDDKLTKREAMALLDRILRPVDYALSQTFKRVEVELEKEHLRALQIALVHWDYYSRLPRFGPHATWNELEASGNDPHRALTKEERMAVTDLAFQLLPPQVFISLASNGIKKYKNALDEKHRASI